MLDSDPIWKQVGDSAVLMCINIKHFSTLYFIFQHSPSEATKDCNASLTIPLHSLPIKEKVAVAKVIDTNFLEQTWSYGTTGSMGMS